MHCTGLMKLVLFLFHKRRRKIYTCNITALILGKEVTELIVDS